MFISKFTVIGVFISQITFLSHLIINISKSLPAFKAQRIVNEIIFEELSILLNKFFAFLGQNKSRPLICCTHFLRESQEIIQVTVDLQIWLRPESQMHFEITLRCLKQGIPRIYCSH